MIRRLVMSARRKACTQLPTFRSMSPASKPNMDALHGDHYTNIIELWVAPDADHG